MTLRVSRDWGSTWQSTVVYPNSSWYSGLAVVEGGGGKRKLLLAFAKDCNETLYPRGYDQNHEDRKSSLSGFSALHNVRVGSYAKTSVTLECVGISLWSETLNVT